MNLKALILFLKNKIYGLKIKYGGMGYSEQFLFC